METNASLWSSTARLPSLSPIEGALEVDVAIVGAGITGLTAAVLLAEEGQRVVVLEARAVGSGVSHRSTVHMTEAVDTRYTQIEEDFGKEAALLVAASSRAAMDRVVALVEAFSIGCQLLHRPGFLYTERDADVAALRDEHAAARRAGLAVDLEAAAPLPFPTKAALRFPDQLQLHIMRYLSGLASAAMQLGAKIHERSRVVAIEDGEPCLVQVEHGPTVRARHVLCATDAPLNRVFLQTKLAAYRSYVVAFRDVALHDGLYWDMDNPYHYLSSVDVDGVSFLLVGGEDHKTGEDPRAAERFEALARWTRDRIKVPVGPTYRWSAQVREPVDGLPFIGRNAMSEHVMVATGFAGNGTTFGTLAAMIALDLVRGRTNPYAQLYAATRIKPVASASTFVGENIDFPVHFIGDRLLPPEAKSLGDIRPGEGKTVRVRGERLAVYRDPSGSLHALSAVCPHLGCLVKFNTAERTWDCPCHGSRFAVDGTVLDGPATRGLARRMPEPARRASVVAAAPSSAGRSVSSGESRGERRDRDDGVRR